MDLKWICCSLLFLLINPNSAHKKLKNKNDHQRIMNGTDVVKHFPWVAAIAINDFNFTSNTYVTKFEQWCGGAIINRQFIVTAAHCVFYANRNIYKSICPLDFFMIPLARIKVIMGHYNLNNAKPHDLLGVKRIIYHSKYNQCTLENDIALLELRKKLPKTHITIPISNKWINPRQKVTVAGWGNRCYEKENKKRRLLSYANLVVKDANQCNKMIYDKSFNTFLCAATEGRSIQQGDSGSGLWMNNGGKPKLVGVVSMAVPCTLSHCGGLYTRLSYYKAWISNKINGKQEL